MRITIIHAAYYYSGSEKSVELLARWLKDNGYEINIISVGNYNAPKDLRPLEKNIMPNINKAITLRALLPITKVMKDYEGETDIYHIYNVFPMSAAGLYKLIGGKRPVIATLVNYAGFCPSASAIYDQCNRLSCRMRCLNASLKDKNENSRILYTFIYSSIYPILTNLSKRLDKYIAVTNNVRDIYVKYGYNKDKIIVIPEFMYLTHIPDSTYTSIPKSDNNTYTKILYVGTLSKHKGVDLIIDALNIIKNEYGYDNIYLTIVGKGNDNYKNYCARLVDDYNLSSNVKFIGYVTDDELNKVYDSHNIFIHPARWYEPFGRTIIEALSHGLPCIVSDRVSREMIGDAGLVFRHDDARDLADKIMSLIRDRDLYKLAYDNTINVVRKFDINNIGNKIVNLYNEVIKNTI